MYNKMHLDIRDILADYLLYKTARRLLAIYDIRPRISAFHWEDDMDNDVIAYNNGAIIYNDKDNLCVKMNGCFYRINNYNISIIFFRDGYQISIEYNINYISIDINAIIKINKGWEYNISNTYIINRDTIETIMRYIILDNNNKYHIQKRLANNYYNIELMDIKGMIHDRFKSRI